MRNGSFTVDPAVGGLCNFSAVFMDRRAGHCRRRIDCGAARRKQSANINYSHLKKKSSGPVDLVTKCVQ